MKYAVLKIRVDDIYENNITAKILSEKLIDCGFDAVFGTRGYSSEITIEGGDDK